MDHVNCIYTELAAFAHDVSASFSNLSLVPRVLIGGAAGYFVVKALVKFAPGSFGITFIPGKIVNSLKAKKEFENGIVYLHMYPRKASKKVPNPSPFTIKLETWLRLKNIKYEVVETLKFAKSTGQFPYIIYNGKEYADSEVIMDFLQKELNIKEQLPPAEMGIQRAFISMLDERFYFIYILFRICYDGTEEWMKKQRFLGAPEFVMKYMMRHTMKKAWMQRCIAQGIGRKPRDVIISIGNKDLKALSLYLGDKKFLEGDKITRADCCTFGHLCQVFYLDRPYPFAEFMRRECPNLEPYINRIKADLWPDWSRIVDDSEFN